MTDNGDYAFLMVNKTEVLLTVSGDDAFLMVNKKWGIVEG